ncbi:MAG TPA: [protein-PII] uridylyltransferase [Nevskiales bacterium]|nr:[protein-PII] uridylyltransferase [Nevskiales bacterium]
MVEAAQLPTANCESGELFGLLPGFDEAGLTVAAGRQRLEQGQQLLYKAFDAGVPVENLVRGRARQVDELLTRAWQHFLGSDTTGLCLVAVGGYGRGELLPYSDIDLLILHEEPDLGAAQAGLEAFLTFVWDIGLDLGHSVRTPVECCRQAAADLTIMTTLLESRPLAGNAALFRAMRAAITPDRLWPVRDFFAAKLEEQRARHAKYQDTAYKLEPNVKESPGGLRDLQNISWVAMRHFGTETLHDLVTHDFLTEQEYCELNEHQSFLWRVRFALHRLCERREDRLLFDHQVKVAQMFGYRDASHNLAVEQFMQRYYRTVKALSCLNDMLLQLFQEAILYPEDAAPPEPLNARFQTRHGYIEACHPDVFQEDPVALLEIFYLLTCHRELKGIAAETLRLIRRDRGLIDERLRRDVRARTLFMEMLRQPRGITHELRRMNRYGVLGRYLPAFGQVIGMMQYDLFHTLTVDEHVLFVVRNMRRLALPEFEHELPYASAVFKRLPKPELLYLAGLFHDIAKGRGGDHSELGAAEAADFCLAHGLSHPDSELVAWLVRNHLVMSMTAQRRDISDPKVILEFARQVGDQTRLDYLYLLTVCDIRATNPNLWNSWRASLLQELYAATRRTLERGLHEPIGERELVEETKAGARRLLEDRGLSGEQIDAVWARIEDEHFLRHSSAEIAWQTQAIAETPEEALPLVRVDTLAARGTTVFVYTRDVDYLFGLSTGMLARLGLNILDARIGATRDGYTLDTYVVMEGNGAPIVEASRFDEIRDALRRVISDPKVSSVEVGRRLPRQLKHFNTPTQIFFSQDVDRQRTLVEVVTGDRPGLLSTIGAVFKDQGILVEAAKIGTIGERAEDVFYVTDTQHKPITDPARFHLLRQALTQALDADPAS